MEGKLALVLSTDTSMRDLLHDCLTGKGCEVQVAKTVAEASSLLEDFNFDLLVANQKLNDGNSGSVFINETKKSHPKIKTILLSSYPKPTGFDADGFVLKPFEIDNFINMAHALINTE